VWRVTSQSPLLSSIQFLCAHARPKISIQPYLSRDHIPRSSHNEFFSVLGCYASHICTCI
jgi:hypothetical protein